MVKHVVIGNGVAGILAAQAVMSANEGADVHILASERYPYYQRPRLWEFIAGNIEKDDLFFRPMEWYTDKGIQIHLDVCVTSIEPESHRLKMADGSTVDYDRLLLATGARPFVPPIDGVEKEGVFVLRTLEDALAIKEYARHSSAIAVIGGGLLGLETARALKTAGLDVTVIEFSPYLLPRQLDEQGARVLQTLLKGQGLQFLTGAETEAILGNGQVTGVRAKDGRVVDCQMVLVSTGIRSRVELARDAGLDVNRAVVVDHHMATSAEDIYAAGDVTEFEGVTYGIIPAAIEQARIAAANMVEPGSATYNGTLRSTTLKVVGVDLTCLGDATASGTRFGILRQADSSTGVYQRLVLCDGKIVGSILLGDTTNIGVLKKLIKSERDVSAYKNNLLADNFDLRSLLS